MVEGLPGTQRRCTDRWWFVGVLVIATVLLVGAGTVTADDVSVETGNAVQSQTESVTYSNAAEINIDTPGGEYVPGTEVNLTGTVSEGIESVDVFVRHNDNWYFVDQISVDTDDNTYAETDFNLANDAVTQEASRIVGIPGTREYGVIDTQDVDKLANETDDVIRGNLQRQPDGMEPSDFDSSNSTQQTLDIVGPTLEAEIETTDGRVPRGNGVNVTGELIGPRDYVVLFVGSLGSTWAAPFTADEDGEIDETGIDISADIPSGSVQAIVLSPGRDTTFGDGSFGISQVLVDQLIANGDLPAGTEAPIRGTIYNFIGIAGVAGQQGYTQSQVQDLLLSETVEDDGSDDLIVTEEFRLSNDSRTENTTLEDQIAAIRGSDGTLTRNGIQNAIFEFVAGDGEYNGVELTREGLQNAVFEFVAG